MKFAKIGKPSFRPRYGLGARFGVLEPLTSALGHKRTSPHVRVMSALPPKADIVQRIGNVRFVPKADILKRPRGHANKE